MKNDRPIRLASALGCLVLLVGAACSGGPPTAQPTGALDDSGLVAETGSTGSTATGKVGKLGKKSGSTGVSTTTSTSSSSPTAAVPSGTGVTATGERVSQKEQAKRSERLERGLPKVNLYSGDENYIGITEDRITLCIHAALTFAEAFDTRVEDLNVYWEWVNANGGIYGREVVMTYEDDAYRPDNAVQAAERCKAKNIFFLGGGIGFDQIPAVRNWAETNRMLYIHHIARADFKKKYSFSFLPTVEQMGTFAAKWILSSHRNEKIGVLWRQSESWEPGHQTFLATMEAGGNKPVADIPVQKDQAVYTQQIAALQGAQAKTVFLWENALAAIEVIKQAKAQDYHPTWVVFPFNTTTDALGADALNPKLEGIASWPAYTPGVTTGPFAGYAADIKAFEAAHRQFGRASKTNDILWQTWVGWKQLHQLLLDCGPDCGRNELVAHLISGQHKAVSPACPFDFTRNLHVGGIAADVFTTWNNNGAAAWQPVRRCVRI